MPVTSTRLLHTILVLLGRRARKQWSRRIQTWKRGAPFPGLPRRKNGKFAVVSAPHNMGAWCGVTQFPEQVKNVHDHA
ncbi:unnamed protein product [Gongylonema pulchrum]|uniref:Acyltransferase n=1 Tax=Gongylonema pulchrum TaxID=637853 RepID=A0A183DEZ1_9BILA|nr:unnamed protein product [Gongylonema pulchrum]